MKTTQILGGNTRQKTVTSVRADSQNIEKSRENFHGKWVLGQTLWYVTKTNDERSDHITVQLSHRDVEKMSSSLSTYILISF